MPGGSTITVTFPAEYTLVSPGCSSVTINSVTVIGYTCSASGLTVTVSGAIPNDQFIDTAEVRLSNIVNPVPALATGEFHGSIGIDIAVPNGGGVQLTAASFDSCSVTFDAAYVNQTSIMVINVDPKNSLGSTSSILVDLPTRWANDIVSTSTLPITSTMVCVNYSTTVSASPSCAGNTVSFTVTASNLLSASTTNSFSFGVKNFISPPTLQPSDSIIITSYIGSYQVDTCTVFPSGLIANPFSAIAVTALSTMTVNTNVGLKFDLTLADFCN